MQAVLRAFFMGGLALTAMVGDQRSFTMLLTVRISSGRPGGQFTLFEFVIIFLVGGVAIGAEDVMAGARSKSIFDVKYAFLERNGTISIITHDRSAR